MLFEAGQTFAQVAATARGQAFIAAPVPPLPRQRVASTDSSTALIILPAYGDAASFSYLTSNRRLDHVRWIPMPFYAGGKQLFPDRTARFPRRSEISANGNQARFRS